MPLNNAQKDDVEFDALMALAGTSSRDLVHGFRVHTSRGQVAAIYWNNVAPGNDIEVALADNRITAAYDTATVQRWIQREQTRHPNPCNVHQYGSDWPILGLRLAESGEFFKRCRALRLGFLDAQLLSELNARQRDESPEEQAAARLKADLAALRPASQQAVIDLVRRAGIDVSPWYVRADNSPASTPRSNPAYCYNWAFGGKEQPALACVWHSSLGIANGHIQMEANIRELALRLEEFAANPREPNVHRDRARTQAARARQLDALLGAAAAAGAPLRVIVNEGEMLAESDLGRDSSVVRVRHLDPLSWHFSTYDDFNGAFVLRRGFPEVNEALPQQSVAVVDLYTDQHDLAGSDAPERRTTEATSIVRDAAVRSQVLVRANGRCEFCDAPGFRTHDGRLYVETHHVVPLSESGPDRVWNVVALCPNHHREAHSGAQASMIRRHLITMLEAMYPLMDRTSANN